MLKTKSKILLALFLVLALVSSYCFATVEPRTSEPVTTSEGDVSAISETEGEAVTTTEGEGETTSTEEETPSWTNGDLYICDDKVEVSNVVDGNAFIIDRYILVTYGCYYHILLPFLPILSRQPGFQVKDTNLM